MTVSYDGMIIKGELKELVENLALVSFHPS
jgi:hypothetical protein